MRATTSATAAVLAAVIAGLTACSASYDERKTYLDDNAAHGVSAHTALVAQGVSTDRKRCDDAYDALKIDVPYVDYPPDRNALAAEGKRLFLDSCVSGTPAASAVFTSSTTTSR